MSNTFGRYSGFVEIEIVTDVIYFGSMMRIARVQRRMQSKVRALMQINTRIGKWVSDNNTGHVLPYPRSVQPSVTPAAAPLWGHLLRHARNSSALIV